MYIVHTTILYIVHTTIHSAYYYTYSILYYTDPKLMNGHTMASSPPLPCGNMSCRVSLIPFSGRNMAPTHPKGKLQQKTR